MTNEQRLHGTHTTLLGIHYQGTNIEICLLGTKKATTRSLHFDRGDFLFYLGVHSGVLTCLPTKPRLECTEQFNCSDGFSLLICSKRHIMKQWEVAILILINTSASLKFRIVEMDK